MTFLSAGLLAGLLLAAVPIIIHILNRRRFTIIDWPPMKYLKMTLKKNRKRVRIEQMILLAMRTLAVILLILAVARPIFSQGGLGRFLPGKGRTSRVIVIDDSLSMGYTVGGRTAFQAAQNAAADLIHEAGGQDGLSLLVTSSPNRPLVKDGSMQEAAKYADLVQTLPLTDTGSNWARTFEGVVNVLGSAVFSNKEVVLITDLRRSGWGADVTGLANKLAGDRVAVRVIDVGDRRMDNLSLLKFEVEDAIALQAQSVHLRAVIRNNSGAVLAAGQATLSVEGDSRPVLLPDIAAGGTVEVPLTLNLENAGNYAVSLTLGGGGKDAMPGDDTRYLTLTVRPTVSVVMMDGEVSAQPFESETDFLALAYSIGATPWKVERISDFDARRWRVGSGETPDVMVLANVSSLTPEQAGAIEKLVANGMGLIVFTGELVDGEAYNRVLFKEGKGLLPVKLERGTDTPTAGIVVEKDPSSPLAALSKLLPEALARVRTRRYTAVEGAGVGGMLPEGVSVLARWNNAENPAAVVEKVFGKGRVLLFTTSAGKKWTDWPLDPTYVLGVRSAALGIARSQDSSGGVVAGEPLRVNLDSGQVAMGAGVTVPGAAAGSLPAGVELEKQADGGTVMSFSKTMRAGVYSMAWKDEKGKAASARFSVNPALAESELEPISEGELAGLMGNLKVGVQRYDVGGVGLGAPPREMWRPLAMIVLALLMAETAFAVFVGRDR